MPTAQGTLWKRGRNDSKSQRAGKFAVRLCLLETSETTSIKSHQCDLPNVNRAVDMLPQEHICICRCVCSAVTVIEKRGNEFEGEREESCIWYLGRF